MRFMTMLLLLYRMRGFSETIGFPMYDAKNSITLRMPVPDLKRITYASIEEMVSDAWVSPTAVELRLLVAIAKA